MIRGLPCASGLIPLSMLVAAIDTPLTQDGLRARQVDTAYLAANHVFHIPLRLGIEVAALATLAL